MLCGDKEFGERVRSAAKLFAVHKLFAKAKQVAIGNRSLDRQRAGDLNRCNIKAVLGLCMQMDDAARLSLERDGNAQPGTDLLMRAFIIALAVIINNDVLPAFEAITFDLEQVFALCFTRVLDDRCIRVGLEILLQEHHRAAISIADAHAFIVDQAAPVK